jgi:outer membrane lipoprotein-sorting protein
MTRILLFLSLLFCSFHAKAQYPGFVLLNQSEIFKKSFAQATTATESIQSDFSQEKTLSMLSEKINSKGKFWYRRKDMLRMEYIQPYSYIMILNGGEIFIKDGQKESKFSAGSNKVFQQVNRILLDCVSGKMLENPDFQYRVFENSGAWLVELSPLAKNLKKLYKNINIVIDKKDYSAKTIEMVEISGDKTIIRFLNKELNAQIPDSAFTIP